MELFIGTVAVSAEAKTFTNRNPATSGGPEPVVPDYLRPKAVKSEDLDTAVNPAPWPTPRRASRTRRATDARTRTQDLLHRTGALNSRTEPVSAVSDACHSALENLPNAETDPHPRPE